MEEIKAYKCRYCGKLYQRKHACMRHEDNGCLKNPKVRPVCFDCNLMQFRAETEYVDCLVTTKDGSEVPVFKEFRRTICRETGKKMYVNKLLPENVKVALNDKGWEAMPTHAEGCKYAKKVRKDKEW